MNEPPETSDPETCARFLRELGASGERGLPIAEAALALASFERPRVAFRRYRDQGITRVVTMLPSAPAAEILPILDRWAGLIRQAAH